ncbi:MAG: aquaporin [Planctomycetes bacterium]|nr:aquaporin [Planctomycetota bacterium]
MTEPNNLLGRCVAELVGTFILVFFGCGAVHVAVLTGALNGLWQVAVVWGVAIMIAVFATAAVSGAHINPAMTLGFFLWRRFPARLLVPYVLSQLGGAILAAAALFMLYAPFLEEKENSLGIARGQPQSVVTAMCYGEYFPNPGRLEALFKDRSKSEDSIWSEHHALVPVATALFGEFLGTLLLALSVFAITDDRNAAGPGRFAPVFIGLTVAILICVIAPLTQACFNPARDFGPRLFAYFAGWGEAAIPGPNGHGFWSVYIFAPFLGAITGGGLYQVALRPFMAKPSASTHNA